MVEVKKPNKANGHVPKKGLWNAQMHPTTYLPFLVFLDMFAVGLVVPLLHQYFIDCGVTNASQRELLSSLFSSSQIVGGIVLGASSDAKLLSRRNTLLLSFVGSAVSYSLIVKGGIWPLIFSRVIVGFVKQTMTVSIAILAMNTTEGDRAIHMGRLKAGSTISWIVAPSAGALLYKNVDPYAPALLASALFLINAFIASILVPKDILDGSSSSTDKKPKSSTSKFTSFTNNLKLCFTSKSLASVVVSLLILTWMRRATSYQSMSSYYEELYGIEPHQRGYLSSYNSAISFISQSLLVQPLLKITGGERPAAFYAAVCMTVATILEMKASFWVFIIFLCPIISISVSVLDLCLKTLITLIAPKDSLGSCLAALDVLQNIASVTVPFYRTFLFVVLAKKGGGDKDALMTGDPDPYLWLASSSVHWIITSVIFYFLLFRKSSKKVKPQNGFSGDGDKKKVN